MIHAITSCYCTSTVEEAQLHMRHGSSSGGGGWAWPLAADECSNLGAFSTFNISYIGKLLAWMSTRGLPVMIMPEGPLVPPACSV